MMEGPDTTTGYAQDIQPMFRPGDIACMKGKGFASVMRNGCANLLPIMDLTIMAMRGASMRRFRTASCRPTGGGRRIGQIFIRS